MAFAAMGLKLLGRRDLARKFVEAYCHESQDDEGRRLVAFYTAYRAAVRGKVELIKSQEPEVAEEDRAMALEASRAFWLLALGELESLGQRPAMVAIAGLSGTGKSTLAAEMGARGGFTLIRSDVVRKELAGAAGMSMAAEFERGIYTPEWTERTYAECLRRAHEVVFEGGRAIIDASFREDARRRELIESATRWGVPVVFVVCQADPQIVRQRLAARSGDASDADWSIYQQAAASWEAPSTTVAPYWHGIDSGGTREDTVLLALKVLDEAAV
jgi:predicted kinase